MARGKKKSGIRLGLWVLLLCCICLMGCSNKVESQNKPQAKPNISYLSPSSYSPSVFSTEETKIGGEYFGDRKGIVRFGNIEAKILSWSNDLIIVEVPDIGRNEAGFITDSTYMVVVENEVGASNSMAFEVVKPEELDWDVELPEELP